MTKLYGTKSFAIASSVTYREIHQTFSNSVHAGFEDPSHDYPVVDNLTSLANENFIDRPLSRFISTYTGIAAYSPNLHK